jgi:hypothetical protein
VARTGSRDPGWEAEEHVEHFRGERSDTVNHRVGSDLSRLPHFAS